MAITEGVLWNILIDPIEISQAQQSAFESLIGQNARPIQTRNDRVLRFGY